VVVDDGRGRAHAGRTGPRLLRAHGLQSAKPSRPHRVDGTEGDRIGGAESAFEDVVPPPRARRVARRIHANRALAEEAAPEALLRAFRFWSARPGAEAWPWARSLVVRERLRASSAAGQRGAPVGPAARCY